MVSPQESGRQQACGAGRWREAGNRGYAGLSRRVALEGERSAESGPGLRWS